MPDDVAGLEAEIATDQAKLAALQAEPETPADAGASLYRDNATTRGNYAPKPEE